MKNVLNKFKCWLKSEIILEASFFELTLSNKIVFFMAILLMVKLFWFVVNTVN